MAHAPPCGLTDTCTIPNSGSTQGGEPDCNHTLPPPEPGERREQALLAPRVFHEPRSSTFPLLLVEVG